MCRHERRFKHLSKTTKRADNAFNDLERGFTQYTSQKPFLYLAFPPPFADRDCLGHLDHPFLHILHIHPFRRILPSHHTHRTPSPRTLSLRTLNYHSRRTCYSPFLRSESTAKNTTTGHRSCRYRCRCYRIEKGMERSLMRLLLSRRGRTYGREQEGREGKPSLVARVQLIPGRREWGSSRSRLQHYELYLDRFFYL